MKLKSKYLGTILSLGILASSQLCFADTSSISATVSSVNKEEAIIKYSAMNTNDDVKLPDGSIACSVDGNYRVTKDGTYVFELVDDMGTKIKSTSVEVKLQKPLKVECNVNGDTIEYNITDENSLMDRMYIIGDDGRVIYRSTSLSGTVKVEKPGTYSVRVYDKTEASIFKSVTVKSASGFSEKASSATSAEKVKSTATKSTTSETAQRKQISFNIGMYSKSVNNNGKITLLKGGLPKSFNNRMYVTDEILNLIWPDITDSQKSQLTSKTSSNQTYYCLKDMSKFYSNLNIQYVKGTLSGTY